MSTQITTPDQPTVTPRLGDLPDVTLPGCTIDENWMEIARLIARARYLSFRDADCSKTYGNQSGFDAHLTGVLGEMAVKRLLEEPQEQAIHIFGDGGADLRIGQRSADVKTTTTDAARPNLVIRADQPLRAELYILAHRHGENKVGVVGYTTREVVEAREPIEWPGDTLNYVVPWEDLHVFPTP